MNRHHSSGLIGITFGLAVGAASASTTAPTGFDIDLNFLSPLTATQTAAFVAAETFWENSISGYQNDFVLPTTSFNPNGGVRINAQIAPIDGPGTIAGQAGPTTFAANGSFVATISGSMTFDSADIAVVESSGVLEDLILHEMAHVLGWGIFWSSLGLTGFPNQVGPYVNGTGQYTGGALATYHAECDPSATFIPVEISTGRDGTDNGHWSETDFACGSDDLMTGTLSAGGNPVSDTTLAVFRDIGFTLTSDMPVVPAPMPLLLGLSAFGALGALRLGRRRQT